MFPAVLPGAYGSAPRNDYNIMDISIIVPCARPEKVKATIEALLNQDFPAGEYEIIVVVPREEDGAIIQSSAVSVVIAGQLFAPGKMRNIGARNATGRYLFFIDDDCIPRRTWLGSMKEILESSAGIGALGCRVTCAVENFWSRCADFALFSAYQFTTARDCDLGSAALAMRKEAFESVGGFDETLLASEDWDFSLKLKSKGWNCRFEPGIEVSHDHRRGTFNSIMKQGWMSGLLSGVTIPARYYEQMTWLAKLSVKMGSGWLYWLLILPYALANTVLQAVPFLKKEPMVILYAPFLFLTRFAYHLGVWRKLMMRLP